MTTCWSSLEARNAFNISTYLPNKVHSSHKLLNVKNHIKREADEIWCDPNKAYSLGQCLGPNHAQGPIHGPYAPSSPSL